MKFNVLDNDTAQWVQQSPDEFLATLRGTVLAGGSDEGRFELGQSVDEMGFTPNDYASAQRAMETQFLHGNLSIAEARGMVELHKKVCAAAHLHRQTRYALVEKIRKNPSYNNLVQLD